jgi:hypothetical protein
MASFTDYFKNKEVKNTWHLGDRVFGKWNKIPFVGTVMIENMISEDEGRRVIVSLDLPLNYKKEYLTILTVKVKDLKKLTMLT